MRGSREGLLSVSQAVKLEDQVLGQMRLVPPGAAIRTTIGQLKLMSGYVDGLVPSRLEIPVADHEHEAQVGMVPATVQGAFYNLGPPA